MFNYDKRCVPIGLINQLERVTDNELFCYVRNENKSAPSRCYIYNANARLRVRAQTYVERVQYKWNRTFNYRLIDPTIATRNFSKYRLAIRPNVSI